MEINKEDLEAIRKAGESIFINELKSYFLLGNTNEYDNFEPKNINVNEVDAFTKYKYACCLYAGYKIDEDEDKAFKLWKELADVEQPNALLEYSAMLFNEGKNEEAFKQLQIASKAGFDLAQFRIALCYLFGYGVDLDDKKAFKIFEMLASKDDPNGTYMLGSFYMTDSGVFVQRDAKKGWELIKKAAKLGSAFAQYEVAIQMCVTSDENEFSPVAIDMLIESANNGDLRAQYLMALLYAKGEGVDMDVNMSMQYLAQSYEGGFPLAIELMDKIKNSIVDSE